MQPSKRHPATDVTRNGAIQSPRAIAALRRKDRAIRRIIDEVGPCTLKPRRDYFASLCEAILAQQLSTKVAATINARFRKLFPRARPTPLALAALDEKVLRAVGLSRQKIGYLRHLADCFSDGTVPRRRLSAMDNDAVIAALTQVKGIGVWTAEMFLIFVLNRADVLPVDDLGLRKAVQLHYGGNGLPTAAEVTALGETWRPYRSLATWYLWQSLRNQPLRS